MPPKTREEGRHEWLVGIFLEAFERFYEQSGGLLPGRSLWLNKLNGTWLNNFPEDERDLAASEAMTIFELRHPHRFFVPEIIGDIIEDVLDYVLFFVPPSGEPWLGALHPKYLQPD